MGKPERNIPRLVKLFISGEILRKFVPTIDEQILINLSGSFTRSPQTVIVSNSSNVSVNLTSSSSSNSLPITSTLACALSDDLNSILWGSLLALCGNSSLFYLIIKTVAVSSSCITDLFSRHLCCILLIKSTIYLSIVEQTKMRSSALRTLENQILQTGISFWFFALPG